MIRIDADAHPQEKSDLEDKIKELETAKEASDAAQADLTTQLDEVKAALAKAEADVAAKADSPAPES